MTAADSSRRAGFPSFTFQTSAPQPAQLPADQGAEIAIAGRSNSGKSSALNRITSQRGLARTSKTPGRTQQLVVFTSGDWRRIIDLPGYGFAHVPESLRRNWQESVSRYLQQRQTLMGLLIVMDARRPLLPLDEQLIVWCAAAGLAVHVLLSKSDKLKRGAARETLRRVEVGLRQLYPQASVQLFSSVSGEGVEMARSVMLDWWGRRMAPA